MKGIFRRSGRYRHVVFADAINGLGRALNLAPQDQVELDETIDADEGSFLRWLFLLGGLDVREYRSETLVRRLPACLRKLRASSIGQARATIQQHPQLLHDALSSMLIGVTGFFRDAQIFEELASSILPDLLERRRPLRIWSVGCSDGQELYSIAMLAAELGARDGAELLGTDCRVHATRAAAEGLYAQSALGGVSNQRLAQHFDRLPSAADSPPSPYAADMPQLWRIKGPLRAMVRWRTANILTTMEPGPWDMILFRNTAMYLRSNAAANLWDRLAGSMSRGGYLVLGRAERPMGTSSLTAIGQYVYRRSD